LFFKEKGSFKELDLKIFLTRLRGKKKIIKKAVIGSVLALLLQTSCEAPGHRNQTINRKGA
jgi:hypothetical protein